MEVTKIDSKDIADLIRTFAMENPTMNLEGSFPCKGDRVQYRIWRIRNESRTKREGRKI